LARQPAVHLERLLLRVLDHVCPRRGSLRVSSRPAWGLSVGGSSAWRTGLRRVEALVEILRERRRHLVRARVRVRVGASLSGASTCAGKRTALCEWREGWRWCLLRVRERQLHHTGVELKKRVEHVHAARRARSEHDRCRAHRSKVGKHGSVRARCWRPREYGTCLYCVALQLGCAQYLGYFERALFWYLCKAQRLCGEDRVSHGVRRLDPGQSRQAGEEGLVWSNPTAASSCRCPHKNHNPS